MDRVESEIKYNKIIEKEDWEIEVIRHCILANKRLWVSNLALIGLIFVILIFK